MSVEEGDKIIAEFMGWYQRPEINKGSELNWFHPVHSPKIVGNVEIPCDVSKLGYDCNWHLLMPVVEKISSINLDSTGVIWVKTYSEPNIYECEIDCELGEHGKSLCFNRSEKTLIEAVYKSVIQFIKWHTTQQTNKD